jgi:predicted nucleic acid-binding protein
MKYILDASVAFKALVAENDSDKARQLIEDYRNGVHVLIAPDILPIEVGHALTRAERQGRVSAADGFALWSSLMADAPLLFPAIALTARAYVLSSLNRLGIYDCIYVALSEQENCEIVTDDARLASLFPNQVISLATL